MKDNLILQTDAYKQSHWKQYPEGTRKIYSYLESRGGETDATLFFGLQMILKRYFSERVDILQATEAKEFCSYLFGSDEVFNFEGWKHIVNFHQGRLPVRIKAVKEGTLVPTGNVLMTVENTDDRVPWITNFVETILLHVWYPMTVATRSHKIKQLISNYAALQGTEVNPFHLNDFGYRGVSSRESAGFGGCAHLVNFSGTDTLEGIRYAQEYYDAEPGVGMSVPAAEHSTVTSWGRENEAKAYEAMMDAYPDGILSIVADSYDIWQVVDRMFGKDLKDKILARNGKLVVRPDSGEPVEMVSQVVQSLWASFGGTEVNGFRKLDPKVGVIYGDGIGYDTIANILEKLHRNKFSVDNVVFGQGGGLLQQVNRDTHEFAFKCSAMQSRDGDWHPVYKEPVGMRSKNSKRGLLALTRDGRKFFTIPHMTPNTILGDTLETVWENGQLVREHTFGEIRERADEQVETLVPA